MTTGCELRIHGNAHGGLDIRKWVKQLSELGGQARIMSPLGKFEDKSHEFDSCLTCCPVTLLADTVRKRVQAAFIPV